MAYYVTKSELAHHGILGMRWGKQNGPPYPLGSGDHSAAEKKAGWRKSLNTKRESKKLYKQLKKDKNIEGNSENYRNNPLIQQIRSKTADYAKKFHNAKENYDFNVYDNPKVWDIAEKEFKKNEGVDYNPNNKSHEKAFDMYFTEALTSLEKKSQSNWDKAFDNYYDALNKEISDVMGQIGNKEVKDIKGWKGTGVDAVNQIIRDLDKADYKKK